MTYASEHMARMGALFGEHIVLVLSALILASIIALPLALLAIKRPTFSPVIVGSLTIIYTIPSLALFAVLVRLFGLGYLPAVVAIAAYAQIFLARAVITGYGSVSPALRENAVAMGMSSYQRLTTVEFPLALPSLLAGLRVATIASIGLATLAGYISAGGMGELIFSGLALRNMQMTLAGSVPVALLAFAVDLALRYGENRARLRAHQ